MVRAAIAFFIIGLLAYMIGANNIGGLSIDAGRMLLFVFILLAIAGFLFKLITGRKLT